MRLHGIGAFLGLFYLPCSRFGVCSVTNYVDSDAGLFRQRGSKAARPRLSDLPDPASAGADRFGKVATVYLPQATGIMRERKRGATYSKPDREKGPNLAFLDGSPPRVLGY